MGKKIRCLSRIIIILIVINIILVGCQRTVIENAEKETAVEIIEVGRRDISKNIVLHSYLQPTENAVVIVKTPGVNVTDVAVNLGDTVEKNEFLFELDKSIIRQQIDQTRQAYDLARKNYEEQKKELKELDNTHSEESLVAMYQKKGFEGINIPSMPAQNGESVLSIAMSQVEQTRAAYSAALSQLKEMEYYSPINGYVSQINIGKNQPVLSNQPAVVISNVDKLKTTIHVSRSLFNSLDEGQNVRVNVDDSQMLGEIATLNPIPDLKSNLYLVEVEINNKEEKLIAGSATNIVIELEKKEEIISIPKSAVLEDNQGKYVFIEKNYRAYRRNIETGIDNGVEVEIIEGLKDKERIIIKGQHFVKDKGLVTVVRGEVNENL